MRYNQIGIPVIPEKLRQKIFKTKEPTSANRHVVRLCQQELEKFGLNPEKISVPKELPEGYLDLIPDILGGDIEEHFEIITKEKTRLYKSLIENFKEIPKPPKSVLLKTGWTKYIEGEDPESVYYPEEDVMVFDVETCVVGGGFPIMASAVTPDAWYFWVSPAMFDSEQALIPLGIEPKIVIGHNVVGFDKKHVRESYNVEPNGIRFLDTLSLHTTVGGLGTKQRKRSEKYHAGELKDDETIDFDRRWLDVTSDNKLSSIAKLYSNIEMDKTMRDYFVTKPLNILKLHFHQLALYCIEDVRSTFEVFKTLYPLYRQKAPSDINLFGQLEMSTVFLPTKTTVWHNFTNNCESLYVKNCQNININLKKLADNLVEDWEKGEIDIEHNPWYSQLDWSISTRAKFLKDKPAWYRDLRDSKTNSIKLTAKTKITPILLNLKWHYYPLYYHKDLKWGFIIKINDEYETTLKPHFLDANLEQVPTIEAGAVCIFYQLPHEAGEDKNVGSPFSKQFLTEISSGVLNSENPLAEEVLNLAISNSFWESNRSRVSKQTPFPALDVPNTLIICPSFLPIGTLTGRATESLWLCAANPKKNKIGTEIKTTIRAPKDWVFVAADIDSEELILSDLFGMQTVNLIGGTPSSFQTLVGEKQFKTDSHSVTAQTIGISRDNAKNLNYSRRYGAGEKATVSYLRSFNKMLTTNIAKELSRKLMLATKGKKTYGKWTGGSESLMFNALEALAKNPLDPRTPILKRALPNCLHPLYSSPSSFLPSKVNFFVQASGVDFLHLWLLATSWLADKFKIPYHLSLTIHDESHWCVRKEHTLEFSLIIQVAHLWAWAYVYWQFGFDDLPFNNAWLSGVDIDFTFRKSPDMDCLTPSQTIPLERGVSKTIYDILEAKLKK